MTIFGDSRNYTVRALSRLGASAILFGFWLNTTINLTFYSLQENLMKNSERLITFLSMTLQRCASLCQLRQTNKDEDFEAGMTERQSLQTALALITNLVTAPSVQIGIMSHFY